ncbi:hypothetical protein [Bradyrhizobium elkanii]|uniref:hypothetical protein n=1 Tax=Bradyrhizobium elkanii TaxID=29448 RepID=UPI00272C89DA|nr:hypothetical protein [Bradyrhizobium elkanii]WLA80307.1 hypothetical protein QNJ99_33720 [Bradyrhizobium elkanii]
MEYAIFKAARAELEAILQTRKAAWDSVEERLIAETGLARPWPMNLTPDAIKMHPDYRAAKAAWNEAWDVSRKLNGKFAGRFKKEIRADLAALRQSRLEK